MSSRISTLIWDIGNVLVRWTPELIYQNDPRFDAATNKEWCDRVIRNPWADGERGWNAEMDRGRSFAETYAERVVRFPTAFPDLAARFPDYAHLMTRYFNEFETAMNEEVKGIKEIKAELQPAFRTLALSNFSKETWPRIAVRFPQLMQFDGRVVSGEVGMVKPDEDIFHHLFNHLSVKPETALFIDDSKANVETSMRLGMRGILFTPDYENPQNAATQLRRDLAAFGL
jgi:2-haloacid dehalogenase